MSSITAIAIPSHGRTGCLRDAINSARAHQRRHGRCVPIHVGLAHGLPDETAATLRTQLASGHPDDAPVELVRLDDLTAAIARRASPEALAALAFLGSDVLGTRNVYGTNRNVLLLHNAGGRVLFTDDDVMWSPGRAPGVSGDAPARLFAGVGRGYHNYQPQELWFFDDAAACLAATTPAPDVDVLAAHGGALGPVPRTLDTTTCLDDELRRLVRTGQAVARISFMGLSGDIGWYAPTWHMMLEGASRDRLHASAHTYERALTTGRAVIRQVTRTTYTDVRFCQSAVIAIDATTPPPPFFPIGRYEDGVFRMLLRHLRPHEIGVHLPVVLRHEPPEARAFVRDDVWRTATWHRTGELMVQLILGARRGSSLDDLAAHLADVAATDDRLASWLRPRVIAQREAYFAHYDELLLRYADAPRAWAEDVRRHRAAFEARRADADYDAPHDLASDGIAVARARLGEAVRRYAAALRAWPELWSIAQDLRVARG